MQNRSKKQPPGVPHITRRSLLKWLGGGTVISLSNPLLQACGSLVSYTPPQQDSNTDASTDHDANTDSMTSFPDNYDIEVFQGTPGPFEFPFEPGPVDEDIYDEWVSFMVDPQDLSSLLESWQLQIDGLVDQPTIFSFTELLNLQSFNSLADLYCDYGWGVYDIPWNGIHLSTLFDIVGVQSEATHVIFHASTGIYKEAISLSVALEEKTMLAYGINGYTLPFKHGFPLRLVIPRYYGYKSVKYLTRIELADHRVNGYWEEHGYPEAENAEIPNEILREGRY